MPETTAREMLDAILDRMAVYVGEDGEVFAACYLHDDAHQLPGASAREIRTLNGASSDYNGPLRGREVVERILRACLCPTTTPTEPTDA